MSNNTQTSIDWLIKELGEYFPHTVGGIELVVKRAKEMRKQELIDFADDYVDNCVIPNENMAIPTHMDVPEYYNKKFNTKENE